MYNNVLYINVLACTTDTLTHYFNAVLSTHTHIHSLVQRWAHVSAFIKSQFGVVSDDDVLTVCGFYIPHTHIYQRKKERYTSWMWNGFRYMRRETMSPSEASRQCEWERKCVEYCLIKLEKDLPCFSFLMCSILCWKCVRVRHRLVGVQHVCVRVYAKELLEGWNNLEIKYERHLGDIIKGQCISMRANNLTRASSQFNL